MLGKALIGWVKREDGSTAIEFSLLAIPYFMLSLGIIELALMFTTASTLEAATATASRMIRTGQIQQTSDDPAAQEEMFREALCDSIAALIDCNDIVLEVVNMGGFGNFDDYAPQFDEDGNLVSQGFSAGNSSDVLLIRTAYRYEMMTPLVGPLLSGPSGSMLFMSTVVLQTEPYEFEGS